MVRKPLLKNDNRTKLFFYDYLSEIPHFFDIFYKQTLHHVSLCHAIVVAPSSSILFRPLSSSSVLFRPLPSQNLAALTYFSLVHTLLFTNL